MKFSTILITSALAMALFQPTIAAPTYYEDCLLGVLCVDHTTDAPYPGFDLSLRDRELTSLDGRQLPSLGSLLGSLPIIGPILLPLIPLLGTIGLSDVDASATGAQSLTASQLATLADLESLLFDAAYEVTTGLPIDAAPLKKTLQSRGLLPLGSILTGLPIIGPFLQPLLPLLDAIGLASVDASLGAVSSMSLNEDQNAKLAQLKTILEQDVPDIMPKDNATPSPSTTPSGVSPEADSPAATPTSAQ